MRRSVLLALVSLSLLLPLGWVATSASAHDADRTPGGLLITYRGWGRLHRGMTAHEAQRTGMVSTKLDHCAPGYQLTKPYALRGFLTWNTTAKPWTVQWIVVVGKRDHTKEGTHPGTTLRQLRRQHPRLSPVVRAGSLTGQVPSKKDVWVAWVQKPYGTLDYQFPYGPRPKPGSRIDSIVVSRKPAAFYGC
jgi:hypothetical protein